MSNGIKQLYWRLRRSLAQLGYHTRPSFLIIGAQKAGTSALYAMLGQHPQIVTVAAKELGFFSGRSGQYTNSTAYHSVFPLPHRLTAGKITGEATPEYLFFPECPQRIYEYASDMKLIAILREPVARAFSGWNMYRRFSQSYYPPYRELVEHRAFTTALMDEMTAIEQSGTYHNPQSAPYHYVGRGMYAPQLRGYFHHFRRDNLLVLGHHDLLHNSESCLSVVCQFLELDSFNFQVERKNVSRYESAIPETAVRLLQDFYAPHNNALFQLLGKELDW